MLPVFLLLNVRPKFHLAFEAFGGNNLCFEKSHQDWKTATMERRNRLCNLREQNDVAKGPLNNFLFGDVII